MSEWRGDRTELTHQAALMYLHGAPQKQIARALGCSLDMVKESLAPLKLKHDAVTHCIIANLYRAEIAVPIIARLVQREDRLVQRVARAAGLPPRETPKKRKEKARSKRDAEIVRRFQKGEGSSCIALHVGCHRGTVLNALRAAGIDPGEAWKAQIKSRNEAQEAQRQAHKAKQLAREEDRLRLAEWRRGQVRMLTAQGLSQRRIAEQLGCSRKTVFYLQKELR